MALIKCRECGSDVSTEAVSCPHCGCRVKEKRSLKTWQKVALVSIPLIIAVVVIVSLNATAWQRVFTVEYVGFEPNYGYAYYEYEITNSSKENVKSVYAVIRVKTLSDGDVEFTDYVVFKLRPGEETSYQLRQSTIRRECEAQGVDVDRRMWYSEADIVGFEWE